MRSLPLVVAAALCAAAVSCQNQPDAAPPVMKPAPFEVRAGKPVEAIEGEARLRNVRQLTFGGENAEAYWSFDGTKLILQSKRPPYDCDQIALALRKLVDLFWLKRFPL